MQQAAACMLLLKGVAHLGNEGICSSPRAYASCGVVLLTLGNEGICSGDAAGFYVIEVLLALEIKVYAANTCIIPQHTVVLLTLKNEGICR